MPQIGLYNRDTDPASYVDKYMSWMELQGVNDDILCRAFPMKLGDQAHKWFRMMPNHSIKSWDELTSYFLT